MGWNKRLSERSTRYSFRAQASVAVLKLRLAAELDHPVRRDAEEIGCRERVAVHDLENPATEAAEVRMFGRHDLDAANEE
jgi:hypothetical protein